MSQGYTAHTIFFPENFTISDKNCIAGELYAQHKPIICLSYVIYFFPKVSEAVVFYVTDINQSIYFYQFTRENEENQAAKMLACERFYNNKNVTSHTLFGDIVIDEL